MPEGLCCNGSQQPSPSARHLGCVANGAVEHFSARSQRSWSQPDLHRYPPTESASKLRLCSLSPDSSQTHLGCVAADEVVHGLLPCEPAHGRQHPERVAAQQDQVLGVRPHAGDARIVNVLDGVRGTRVLGHRTAGRTQRGQRKATARRKRVGQDARAVVLDALQAHRGGSEVRGAEHAEQEAHLCCVTALQTAHSKLKGGDAGEMRKAGRGRRHTTDRHTPAGTI